MLKFYLSRVKKKHIFLLFLLCLFTALCDFYCRYIAGNLCASVGSNIFILKMGYSVGINLFYFVLNGAFKLFSARVLTDFQWNLKTEIERSQLFSKEESYFLKDGQKIDAVQEDAAIISMFFQRMIKTCIPEGIMCLICLTAIWKFSPILGVIGIFCVLLPIPFVLWTSRSLKPLYEDYYSQRDKVIETEEAGLFNLELFQMLRLEKKYISEHNQMLLNLKRKNRSVALKESFLGIPTMIFTFLTTIIMGVTGGLLCHFGKISMAELISVFLFIDCFLDPVMTLDGTISKARKASMSQKRVEVYITSKEKSHDNLNPISSPHIDEISFIDICPRPGIFLGTKSFKKGKLNIILGKNGVGKSSLISSLMGTLDVYEGRIELNSIPLSMFNISDVRKKIAVCTQNITVFPCSIESNFEFRNSNNDNAKFLSYLEQSGLAEEVKKLPDGLKTVLGENGEPLSKGQQQRVQIIKTLLKEADIYIFDESDVSFSGDEKEWFLTTIQDLAKNKIVIWITHDVKLPKETDIWYIGERNEKVN